MRILLVSDIHSNRVALQAVLDDASRNGGWDAVWNMGDTVGYGPEPAACLDLVQELGGVSVAGNHDWGVVKKVPLTEFNYAAAFVNHWTTGQLGPAHRRYLEELPLTRRLGEFTLVHGSPRDPIWEYLLESPEADANLQLLETPHAVIGHSHMALAFWLDPQRDHCQRLPLTPGKAISLRSGRWVINPGSVGQPRDRDPRAAYAFLDDRSGTLTAHRVEYDIGATQAKMAEVGLPVYLAERLAHGR